MDGVVDEEAGREVCELEVMTLREALATSNEAVTTDGIGYVRYNEDNHVAVNRPWEYVSDTRSWSETWLLQDDQLDRLVLFSQLRRWVPASKVVFEW